MPSNLSTYFAYNMPFGKITIASNTEAITRIMLGEQALQGEHRPVSITNECANELMEYFAGKRTIFDLPIKPEGSAFQLEVWRACESIPYGQTMTYQDIAKIVGKPSAYRSIGSAINANPIVVLIPAHRVIPANGIIEADTHAKMRAAFRELESRFS